MSLIELKNTEEGLVIGLSGHIDSGNAPAVEEEITAADSGNEGNVIIDAEKLEYISSAGLRILLRLKKKHPDLKVINVSNEVYEIFDMTGFSEMMEVQKGYRTLSMEGCEIIGQGANGTVYRLDPDTIVKVYKNADALPDIKRERELARTALILGVPTAIPYDVVKVGDNYGSVYELLNSQTFAKIILDEPQKKDEIIDMSVDLLKKIHATEAKPDTMPDFLETGIKWVTFMKDYLPAESYEKLYALIQEVPHDLHMIHGDYHLKNIMLQDGEALLIDMDTISTGHPVFEFASIFNAYQGFGEADHGVCERFLGLPYDTCCEIWKKTVDRYFADRPEEERKAIVDKARIIGYTRIIRREIRRDGLNRPEGKALIDRCTELLIELLKTTDTLLF